MCGRYYIPDDDDDGFQIIYEQIQRLYENSPLLAEMKRGEIFPTNIVPVYAGTVPTLMRWGFPGFKGKGQIINARIETTSAKPIFRKAYASQRCLIPASNYFEWLKDGAQKQKYSIGLGKPFYMAGLYKESTASPIPLFVILTRQAAPGIEFIHDRMPVILTGDLRKRWINYDMGDVFDTSPDGLDYYACS